MSRSSLARTFWVACALALASIGLGAPVHAAESRSSSPRSTARNTTSPAASTLDLSAAIDPWSTAEALARVWSPDANLVYVESVQAPASDGSAAGWTFVFWSEETREARSFTVNPGSPVEESGLPFAFDAPAVEGGWIDAAQALARARMAQSKLGRAMPSGNLAHVALSRGLWGAIADRRTTWLFVFGELGGGQQDVIVDALEGRLLAVSSSPARGVSTAPAGIATAGSSVASFASGQLALLQARRPQFVERVEALRNDPRSLSKQRRDWLAAREAAALERLASQTARRDSLAAPARDAGANADSALAALADWRSESAAVEAALDESEARVAAAERDLDGGRKTQIAVLLAGEGRARPAHVTVWIDGVPVRERMWSEREWLALDGGAHAEVARATVRPLAHEVRIEIEDADHRKAQVVWRGSATEGSVRLVRVRLARTADRLALELTGDPGP